MGLVFLFQLIINFIICLSRRSVLRVSERKEGIQPFTEGVQTSESSLWTKNMRFIIECPSMTHGYILVYQGVVVFCFHNP